MVIIEVPVYVTSASCKPRSLIGQMGSQTAFCMVTAAFKKFVRPLILFCCCCSLYYSVLKHK